MAFDQEPRLKSTARGDDKLTEKERRAVAAKAYANPAYFARFFLSDKFCKPMPWLHRGILAILTRRTDFLLEFGEEEWGNEDTGYTTGVWDERQLNKIVSHFVNNEGKPVFTIVRNEVGNIARLDMDVRKFNMTMIPRGFSKTTLVGLACILYWILYEECRFPLYVSEAGDHAKTQLRNLRDEIEFNERVIAIFGNIVPDRTDPQKWTDEFFQTTTGICCAARGRGGQVRGLNVKGQRPDRVVGDDIEDEESVSTDVQREKVKKWFFKSLKPVLPKMDKSASIYMLGTLLHHDSLLATLRKDPEWNSIVFGAVDNDGEAMWEDNMSLEDLEREKLSFARNGQLAEFYLEYMSLAKDDDTAVFAQKAIYHRPYTKEECIARAIAIDPAISDKATADFCAFAVMGITDKGVLPLLDFYMERGMSPREQIDKYFELAIKWDCNKYGVEAIAYQAALIHLMREEMFRKKRYFEIIKITHGKKKDDRIRGILAPRYAAGYIPHSRPFPDYEAQLVDYPNGKIDGPDVVSMAVSLLDPYAAAAADPEVDLGDDEYPDLDEVFGGEEWRSQ